MRVFLTGATGFVGSAVLDELRGAGHQVLGLARNDTNAHKLEQAGALVQRGELTDLDSLIAGAKACDAVIHTAFIHDFSKFKENCEIDRAAIEALGSALVGTNHPMIVTSGTALISPGQVSTEHDVRHAATSPFPRVSEEAAASLAERGVRVSVMRLPPSVHGDGDHGFVPILIGIAREKGFAAYVGEGQNRWPGVHRLDAAVLYRLAIESGCAKPRYHAIADEGVPFRELATVIGRRLNLPVVSQTPQQAATHFTWFAHFAAIDSPASSKLTRQWLGWNPTLPGLLADVDRPQYFQS